MDFISVAAFHTMEISVKFIDKLEKKKTKNKKDSENTNTPTSVTFDLVV